MINAKKVRYPKVCRLGIIPGLTTRYRSFDKFEEEKEEEENQKEEEEENKELIEIAKFIESNDVKNNYSNTNESNEDEDEYDYNTIKELNKEDEYDYNNIEYNKEDEYNSENKYNDEIHYSIEELELIQNPPFDYVTIDSSLNLNRKNIVTGDFNECLMEKQIIKRHFNITETQLKTLYKKNKTYYTNKISLVLHKLEMQLDSILYRAGFTLTILEARQLINYGHIYLNDIKVKKHSTRCKINSIISIGNTKAIQEIIYKNLNLIKQKMEYKRYYNNVLPCYLDINIDTLSIKVRSYIQSKDILLICNELLIKEYYNNR